MILLQQLLQGRRVLCGQLQSEPAPGRGALPTPSHPAPARAWRLSLHLSSGKNKKERGSTSAALVRERQAGPGVLGEGQSTWDSDPPWLPQALAGEHRSWAWPQGQARPSPFFSVIRRTRTPMVSSLASSAL